MKEYFQLQFRMAGRSLKDAGLHPQLTCVILIPAFFALSVYLFLKVKFAAPGYVLLALMTTGRLSDKSRTDFLKLCFPAEKFRKIRVAENFLVTLPFLIFLLYRQAFLYAVILVILSVLLALVNFRTVTGWVIPTPFYKKPFEFTTGFRNTVYFIMVAYILTGIAVYISNFNLGIFSMLLVFVLTMGYYTNPENEFYVWVYNLSPKQLLFEKMKTAVFYSAMLVLPVFLVLGVFFPHKAGISFLFLCTGWAFLVCMIVNKYAAYPGELHLIQGILLAVCIGFPPLLLVFIPYLFSKSVTRLTKYLQ